MIFECWPFDLIFLMLIFLFDFLWCWPFEWFWPFDSNFANDANISILFLYAVLSFWFYDADLSNSADEPGLSLWFFHMLTFRMSFCSNDSDHSIRILLMRLTFRFDFCMLTFRFDFLMLIFRMILYDSYLPNYFFNGEDISNYFRWGKYCIFNYTV